MDTLEPIDILEIIKDPKLVKVVSDKMDRARVIYYYPGKYKRTSLYSLIESNNYNANYFIDEFLKITAKQSKLSKGQRDIIVITVGEAIYELWLNRKRTGGVHVTESTDSNVKEES